MLAINMSNCQFPTWWSHDLVLFWSWQCNYYEILHIIKVNIYKYLSNLQHQLSVSLVSPQAAMPPLTNAFYNLQVLVANIPLWTGRQMFVCET